MNKIEEIRYAMSKKKMIPLAIFCALVLLFCVWFFRKSSEEVYNQAFVSYNAKRYDEAALLFKRAFKKRSTPQKKEEALFWHAKSLELGGHRAEAKASYFNLIENYFGFWVPESLYTYVMLENLDNNIAPALPFVDRLRNEYPGNKWTLLLDSLIKPVDLVYTVAWDAMRNNQYAEAVKGFTSALEMRTTPDGKEEALFWLAKANESAGHKEEAMKRYRELADNYKGYWVPESLYNVVKLGRQSGQTAMVEPFAEKLRQGYPSNSWTKKMADIK